LEGAPDWAQAIAAAADSAQQHTMGEAMRMDTKRKRVMGETSQRSKAPGFILHPGIRRFEKADLPGILRIERASFGRDAWPREAFLEYASAAPEWFLVARVTGRIAGYGIATLTRHGAELDSLAVLPRYRRQGIAAALLKVTMRKARRAGARVISLMVRRKNHVAIKFYRSLGFVRVATVANYYGAGRAGWRMRMPIP
jgi:[ribosomal protein S18]-alanine N-acetyltransferase